jgi:hypothetical protein
LRRRHDLRVRRIPVSGRKETSLWSGREHERRTNQGSEDETLLVALDEKIEPSQLERHSYIYHERNKSEEEFG